MRNAANLRDSGEAAIAQNLVGHGTCDAVRYGWNSGRGNGNGPLGGWHEETSDGKLRDSGRTAIARSTTNQVLRDRGRTAIARSMTNEVLRDSGLTAIARAPNSCEQNHTYQFQSPLRCGQCLRHVFEEPVANEGRVEFPKSGDL